MIEKVSLKVPGRSVGFSLQGEGGPPEAPHANNSPWVAGTGACMPEGQPLRGGAAETEVKLDQNSLG